jgi:hypothetical protein
VSPPHSPIDREDRYPASQRLSDENAQCELLSQLRKARLGGENEEDGLTSSNASLTSLRRKVSIGEPK